MNKYLKKQLMKKRPFKKIILDDWLIHHNPEPIKK